MKEITIKTYPTESRCELVRLQRGANDIIVRLQRESGLSKSHLVSEIIRQAAPFVQFEEVRHV